MTGATVRIGRRGAGPAEFLFVDAMTATPDGGLLVHDWRNARLTTITPAATVGSTISVISGDTWLFRATLDSAYVIANRGRADVSIVSLKDGKLSRRFAPLAADSGNHFFSDDKTDGGAHFWITPRSAGGWYLVGEAQYIVLTLDDHGVRRSSVTRDVPREMRSEGELAYLARLQRKIDPRMTIEAARKRIDAAYANAPDFPINALPAEDTHGRLWIPTSRIRGDSTELDIFENNKFIGTRRVLGEVVALLFHGDELYTLVNYLGGDKGGEQGVVRYGVH